MGECSSYSKVNFAALTTSWLPPVADQLSLRGPKVSFRIWLCAVDDSTLNVVLCIIIIVVIIIIIIEPAGTALGRPQSTASTSSSEISVADDNTSLDLLHDVLRNRDIVRTKVRFIKGRNVM